MSFDYSKIIPLDMVMGTLLAGSWVNIVLLTLEGLQAWRYYTLYPKDGLILKGAVGLSLASDIMSTILNCMAVYLYTIKHWGDPQYVMVQPICMPLILLTIAVSGYHEPEFQNLPSSTRQPWLQKVAGAGLASMSLAILGYGIWVFHIFWLNRVYTERTKLHTPLIVWLSFAVVGDVILASLMVILLLRLRADNPVAETSYMGPVIRRLLVRTVETGCLTAAIVLAALAVLLVYDVSNYQSVLAMCLGKIYTLTVLQNLLGRNRQTPTVSGGVSGLSTSGSRTVSFFKGRGVRVNEFAQQVQTDDITLQDVSSHSKSGTTNDSVFHVHVEKGGDYYTSAV
ncbi:hypothetical protein T439DRAFT_356770 [Meredithblackwellia eburnea MCA 4105]